MTTPGSNPVSSPPFNGHRPSGEMVETGPTQVVLAQRATLALVRLYQCPTRSRRSCCAVVWWWQLRHVTQFRSGLSPSEHPGPVYKLTPSARRQIADGETTYPNVSVKPGRVTTASQPVKRGLAFTETAGGATGTVVVSGGTTGRVVVVEGVVASQFGLVNVSLSRTTAPLRASARP